MTIYRPPPQGAAYAQPDEMFTIRHRLEKGDCAVLPDSRGSVDKTNCLNGPGVIEYVLVPGRCFVNVIEGCTKNCYTRDMPNAT